jgi:uncharacterized protein (DUF305 family)
MHSRVLMIAAFACVTTFGASFGVHAQSAPPQTSKPASEAGKASGSKELHRIMMESHQMPMPMTGDVDRDFAAMMTQHHQQGIKMADVVIKHGNNASLKAIAQKIKEGQREEIAELAPYKGGR